MSNILLEVNNLKTTEYADPVSFSVCGGDIVCIFGMNGSGKSLLIKSICNIFKYYSGNVNYLIDINKRGVCLQFPEHLLYKETAYKEALFITNNHQEAEDVLKEINAEKDISPFSLSDGQKRLLFIYGILKSKDLIIFDEPFVSLDKESKQDVLYKMNHAAKNGKGIIYTANRAEDKVISGKIIEIKYP